VSGVLHWFGAQLSVFAVKPGSTRFGVLLWLAGDRRLHRRRGDASTSRTVLRHGALSALLLAAMRLVPFYERITLWIVPALYVGVAFLSDVTVAEVTPRVRGTVSRPSPAYLRFP